VFAKVCVLQLYEKVKKTTKDKKASIVIQEDVSNSVWNKVGVISVINVQCEL
jgi:hypothetical protein